MKAWSKLLVVFLLVAAGTAYASESEKSDRTPLSAPIENDSAGRNGRTAMHSVVHILCPKEGMSGTGFLHRGGGVITAAHVVSACTKIRVVPASGPASAASIRAKSLDLDLALLSITPSLSATALAISSSSKVAIGTQVTTWGFPGGYGGRAPLLSVGYIAGLQTSRPPDGALTTQWVVNAAFNRGNSGGPLLDFDTGEVVGVVASKLAPISATASSALEALQNQRTGSLYTAHLADGTTKVLSEGQVVAAVLQELRDQMQLVIGQAVLLDDLRRFLKEHGVEP